MIRADFLNHMIAARGHATRLQKFLKRGLRVAASRASGFGRDLAIHKRAPHEPARRLQPRIQINPRDLRFVRVRQKRRLRSPAGLLFSAAEEQIIAQAEALGGKRNRGGIDQACPAFGEMSFGPIRKFAY